MSKQKDNHQSSRSPVSEEPRMRAELPDPLDSPPEEDLEGEFEKESEEIVWKSLKRKEIPVRVEDEGKEYVLVEASAEEARLWRANNFQSLQTREKGKGSNRESVAVFTSEIASSHILLVSLCLFEITPSGRRRVSKETIRDWPNDFVSALFRKAQSISGLKNLEEDDDEEGKPDSPQKKRLGAK